MRFAQNTLGTRQQRFALLGHVNAAPPALEQFCAQQHLQFSDLLAQRRLAHPALVRRPAEMPGAGNRHGVFQVAQGQAGKACGHGGNIGGQRPI